MIRPAQLTIPCPSREPKRMRMIDSLNSTLTVEVMEILSSPETVSAKTTSLLQTNVMPLTLGSLQIKCRGSLEVFYD
jgi:hypothetical protein